MRGRSENHEKRFALDLQRDFAQLEQIAIASSRSLSLHALVSDPEPECRLEIETRAL